jgi:two-component system sensor histidine kinase KdpD
MACAVRASLALQRIELAERAQKSKSFEEADRLKTALLHAVSHDLRTPITVIKTSASNLLNLSSTLGEDERVEMFKTIETEADQLNKMIGNLLDLSRLKAGALQLNRDWNALEDVAGDVAARVWQLTHQERIRIDFSDKFPLVCFDYGLVLQALSNLVDNSLRYEPTGLQVIIRGKVQGDEAHVAVVNHGPTVPPGERELIMEPFYHGQEGNIGLGLAVAKGIIEAHHGRLWVEDTPGGGATFALAFPLTPSPQEVDNVNENPRG